MQNKVPTNLVIPQEGHTLLLETQLVKVFETFLKPGQYLPMHSHQPHLRFCLSPGVNIHTWPNGIKETVTDKAGIYEWRSELTHAVENGGDAVIHSLIFEIKKKALESNFTQVFGSDSGFPSTPQLSSIFGADSFTLLTDNEYARAYDVVLSAPKAIALCLAPSIIYVHEGTLSVTQQSGQIRNVQRVTQKTAVWVGAGDTKITLETREVRFVVLEVTCLLTRSKL